jgi:hypothetical protein
MKPPLVTIVRSHHREALYVHGIRVAEKSNITDADIVRAVVGTVRVLPYTPPLPYGDLPYDIEDVLKELKG